MSDVPKGEPATGAGGLINADIGPPLAFLAAYVAAPVSADQKIFFATGVFMAATIAIAITTRAPNVLAAHMLQIPWLSSALIVVMGALALGLQNEVFIKTQPTLYFGLVAAWSGWTLLTGTPRLQRFGKRDSLSDIDREGWRKMTAFAAGACVLMALLNEAIWRSSSTGFWIAFQLWGWVLVELVILPLSLPVLNRHGAVRKESAGGHEKPSETLEPTRKKPTLFTVIAIVFGPLIAFIAAYVIAPGSDQQKIFVATAALIAATVAASVASRIFERPSSPLSWLMRLLVIVMGSLTLWLQNDIFVKMLLTLQSGLAAVLLGSNLLTNVPRLEFLSKPGRLTGVDREGWRKLIAFAAGFLVLMALLNEMVWRNSSTAFWIGFQFWGRFSLFLLFAATAIPMLEQHGLDFKKGRAKDPGPPP